VKNSDIQERVRGREREREEESYSASTGERGLRGGEGSGWSQESGGLHGRRGEAGDEDAPSSIGPRKGGWSNRSAIRRLRCMQSQKGVKSLKKTLRVFLSLKGKQVGFSSLSLSLSVRWEVS
jgi:hypothetical protein